MLNMIKRSLSGGESPPNENSKKKRIRTDINVPNMDQSDSASEGLEQECENINSTSAKQMPTKEEDKSYLTNIPDDTPDWGKHLLMVMNRDFKTLSRQINDVKVKNKETDEAVKDINGKIKQIELANKVLHEENHQLREKVLDLEYRQRRCNLLFEGVAEPTDEKSIDCANKLEEILKCMPDFSKLEYERCHRLGPQPKTKRINRSIICCFTFYSDVALILRNRKKLPKGVFVSENLPEEWSDR